MYPELQWNLSFFELENITKIKTRYYKKGLRKRLQIFANFLEKKGQRIDIARNKAYFFQSTA